MSPIPNQAHRVHGRLAAIVLAIVGLLAACSDNEPQATNRLFKAVALNGAQENPAVATAAIGTGIVTLDPDSGMIEVTVNTFGITATAAHIHEGAAGVNGPVLVPLTQNPPGTWKTAEGATLTAAQVASLRAGNLYVNVHTAANPSGEIRGQIGRQVYFATLTGAQEVPAVTTAGSGTGRFVLDPETNTLEGSVAYTGFTATVAHIHTAAVGVAGPVTIPLTGGPASWTLPPTVLTSAQLASLTGGTFYANVHSAANPGGEIRGQLYFPAKSAFLSGAQEVPPNSSAGSGTGWLVVNPFTKAVAGRVEFTGFTSTNAHVHRAAAGVAGPVVIPLSAPSATSWVTAASATISDDLLANFMKGELYFNVHSAAYPGGEIRGQLVLGH